MSTDVALQRIAQFLSSLRHTGAAGFEGLVAVLLEAATGQRFTLATAGRQAGLDARSESQSGNNIKVEAKHYGKDALDERELTAELVQANSLGSPLDLWVLAASCRVGEQIATNLEKVALDHNIEVLLLDAGADQMSRIAVLMAVFPQAVENWVQRHNIRHTVSLDELRISFSQLSSNPAFEHANEQIESKLAGTLLGYDDARHRCRDKFQRMMCDRGNALALFNQRVSLQSVESGLIHRVAISNEMTLWWSQFLNNGKNVVLLGEEGAGKTWAGFDWLSTQLDANGMPIVLPFSAAAESVPSGKTIEDFLPALLAKWTGAADAEFWSKRLNRWLKAENNATVPLIVVFADGLGEKPSVPWPSFFRMLEDENWRNRIAIIATDREGHWRSNCAAGGLDSFHEIKIQGYTDSELYSALKDKSIALNSIPEELQTLIRRPRYCGLVAEHFAEMQANSDFTVERLILLDARHRAAAKRGELTEDQFIEIIQNLALQYRKNPVIHLADLRDLWPFADPDRTVHQQIIDGGLLVRKEGFGTKFAVEHNRLVFGLGMLLADEVQTAANKGRGNAQIETEISSWFEPHPEMDLKVEICGAALFHSLAITAFPPSGRREILRYWLGLRNWNDKAQSTFINYVVRCPEDFIAMVDEFWKSSHDVGAAQDFLARAFISYRDDERLQPLLVAAVRRWMGFIHPAGHPILRPDPKRKEKQQVEIEERVGISLKPGPIELCGESLFVVEDEGLLRLKRLGFLIMSAGTVSPFMESLTTWAVASAVMGDVVEAGIVEWILYLHDEPIEQFLTAEIQRLLALHNVIATKAGITLLWRIDPKRAEAICQETGDQQYKQRKEWRAMHAQDPCKSFFAWSDADCDFCQERTDISPLRILDGLGERLFNPDYRLSKSLIARLTGLIDIDPNRFRVDLWATMEDHASRQILPRLALYAPDAVQKFVHSVVSTLPNRPQESRYPLLSWLPDISLLLGPSDVQIISAFLDRLHSEFSQLKNISTDGYWAAGEAFAFLSIAPHLQSAEVFAALIRRPTGALDLRRFTPWFGELLGQTIEVARAIIHSPADDIALVRTLWFLAASSITLSDVDRARIAGLAESGNSSVRWAALRFGYLNSDNILARKIVNMGRSFQGLGGDSDIAWGSRLLVKHSAHLSFASVAARLHPADAGYALAERGLIPDEVREYANMLDIAYCRIVEALEPKISSLPNVYAPAQATVSAHEFPNFVNSDSPPQTKNWIMTWGGGTEASTEILNLDPKNTVDEMNRLSRERVEHVTAAWKTDALQWFGWGFNRAALGRICRDLPDFVRRWVEPAMQEGLQGKRICARLGSFLALLCTLLLEYDPPLGFELWQILRSHKRNPIVFGAAFVAFEAPDNTHTSAARLEILEESNNDQILSELACLAEENGRQQWLDSTIQKMIAAPQLWKKAKALTLASFSNVTVDVFDTYVSKANIHETWVTAQVPFLRANVQKNDFARRWFRLFLEGDPYVGWGALQMVLACADHRFFTWPEFREFQHPRLRYVNSMGRELGDELDRSKDRRNTLFGIKIERGEIFPFMDR